MKYKCRDCGKEFEVKITTCDSCNSIYIIPQENLKFEYLRRKGSNEKGSLGLKISGFIILSLIIWYLYWCGTSEGSCRYSHGINTFFEFGVKLLK